MLNRLRITLLIYFVLSMVGWALAYIGSTLTFFGVQAHPNTFALAMGLFSLWGFTILIASEFKPRTVYLFTALYCTVMPVMLIFRILKEIRICRGSWSCMYGQSSATDATLNSNIPVIIILILSIGLLAQTCLVVRQTQLNLSGKLG